MLESISAPVSFAMPQCAGLLCFLLPRTLNGHRPPHLPHHPTRSEIRVCMLDSSWF